MLRHDRSGGSRDVVDAIKDRVSIPKVLEWLGLPSGKPGSLVPCPFPGHVDPDPSCSISRDGALAHCFGCGHAGDAITLWRERTGDGFRETLAALADRAGVPFKLDEEELARMAERRAQRDALAAALEVAEWCLWNEPGEPARTYLESVGISTSTAKRLRLGYVPGWRTIAKRLVEVPKARFTIEDLDRAGLLSAPRDDGSRLDALAHCVVYPSIERGLVVYLKGRKIDDSGRPEGGAFKHRALDRARVEQPAIYWPAGEPAAIGETVVAVEGEKDGAVVFQALQGAERIAVAVLVGVGRAATAAESLRRYKRTVSLADDDPGGLVARNTLGAELGTASYVAGLSFPEGTPKDERDPAGRLVALIRDEHDADAGRARFAAELLAAVRDARRFLDVRLDEVLAASGGDAGALAELVRDDIAPIVARLPELDRAAWISTVAKRTKLPKRELASSIKLAAREHENKAHADDEERAQSAARRDVEELLAALEKRFAGLYFERNGSGKIAIWSHSRSERVFLDLERYSRAAALLSPDVGDVEAWVLDELPGLERRSVPTRMVGALQEWARRLPPREGLEVLADGLHVLPDDSTLLVDGRRALRFYPDGYGSGHFERVDHPLVDRRFLLSPHLEAERWLPREWDLEKLSAPLRYSPREVADHLRAILSAGWTFREPIDATVHALFAFALTIGSRWTWKPLVHVRAARRSGKSWLVLGFYAGAKKLGLPGMVPPVFQATDVSSSGVIGRLAGSATLLVLDEFEGSEVDRKRMAEILRLLRASRMGGAGKLRGTRDQGFTDQRLDVACVAASIEPISDTDADNSRWFVSELSHDPARLARPAEAFWTYVAEHGLDVDELRRTVLVGLLPHAAELRDLEIRFARNPLPGADKVDGRYLENLLPIFAVAKVLDYDVERLSREVLEAHAEDYREVEEDAIPQRLARALLYSPVRVDRSSGSYTTTLAAELDRDRAPGTPIRVPEAGVWTEFVDERGREEVLVVNWSTARTALLSKTEFGGASEKRLVQIARELPGRLAHGRTRAGGVRVWATRLLVSELLGKPVFTVHEGGGGAADSDESGSSFGPRR